MAKQKKKKMGRPPIPKEARHTERVVSLFTRSEFQDLLDFETDKEIREHAHSVRTLVLEGLRRYKARKQKPSQ